MERRDFLLSGCRACAVLLALPTAMSALEGCSSSKAVAIAGMTEDNGHVNIPLASIQGKQSLVLQPKGTEFPVLLAKENDGSYKALLLRCTHKGGPLNDDGAKLTCTSHGSQFDHEGNVMKGPARTALKSYPVAMNDTALTIDLNG